jgi:hypothetical protein
VSELKEQLAQAEHIHQQTLDSLHAQLAELKAQHTALTQQHEHLQQQLTNITTQRDLLRGMCAPAHSLLILSLQLSHFFSLSLSLSLSHTLSHLLHLLFSS